VGKTVQPSPRPGTSPSPRPSAAPGTGTSLSTNRAEDAAVGSRGPVQIRSLGARLTAAVTTMPFLTTRSKSNGLDMARECALLERRYGRSRRYGSLVWV
jgi:hypothetical protein